MISRSKMIFFPASTIRKKKNYDPVGHPQRQICIIHSMLSENFRSSSNLGERFRESITFDRDANNCRAVDILRALSIYFNRKLPPHILYGRILQHSKNFPQKQAHSKLNGISIKLKKLSSGLMQGERASIRESKIFF